MGPPPVFCVGRTQGSSRADTGEFFSDTGEFEGEFVLMGGVPGRSKQGVFLYERPQYTAVLKCRILDLASSALGIHVKLI